jgi:hypothetical protein
MKKRESFSNQYYEDVEHYEEPTKKSVSATPNVSAAPVTPVISDKQKLRLFLLDQIQDVQDKTLKSELLDNLFSDSVMSKLATMSSAEQKTYVQTAITSMESIKNAKEETPVVKAEPVPEKKHFVPDIKDYFDNNSSNLVNQISSKLDGVLSNIDNMKSGISDIKTLFVNKGPKEPYIPSLPILPQAVVESYTNSLTKDNKNEPNGFENIRSWGAVY